jgi:HK97 family phage major capsid protein
MALKALMLRKKIDNKKKELEAIRAKTAELKKREAELAAAIEEAESDEEQKTVEDEVEAFNKEKAANAAAEGDLDKEIKELEDELAEEERQQDTTPQKQEERKKEIKNMETRTKFGVTSEMVTREDVQKFLGEVRTCISEKRALTNAGLLIPDVFLGLLRENVINYSKLYRHTNVRRIGGEGRMVIMGTVPEAVWTECCKTLNEATLGFNDVEVDCNKVGAYFAVCNALIEDADIDLASELLQALAQGIGLALDKAILYGTGTKMPLGVMTRLVQTEAPADYPATARTWADLHTSNVVSITAANSTGLKLFQNLVTASGAAKGKYARGAKTWVMNETTRTKLIAEGLAVNAAGAIVSGVNGSMPVIGGDIEVLEFIPDNVIIGGYFELYLLAERSTTRLAQSEHYRFVEDQTVFKGTARYDGTPVIPEAFVAIGIGGTTPNATMTFAADTANA